ncbi:hypothetical protein AB0M32_43545 [Streptomyces sp. NPDC051985]|uniref:hypothetical protein n=1 Tax=Streptomyces sp. NPDC051985 TaxID=3155807 RepID=UPI0034302343
MASGTHTSAVPAADVADGIHVVHWGEARLEPDRTFTWLYSEQLPDAPVPLG